MQKAVKVLDFAVKDLPEVENGKFRVAIDGRIYRKRKDGNWELAPQCKTCRNDRYLAVSYSENGKQSHYLSHRLVATAYIPNPNDLPEVNHKDGNGLNNRADNLEWSTRSDNTKHAYQNGLIPTIATAGVPCVKCGEPTMQKDGVCAKCKRKERSQELRLKKEAERMQYVEKIYNLHAGDLGEREDRILSMYAEGCSYGEIGEVFGITRQRVQQIFRKLEASANLISNEKQAALVDVISEIGVATSTLAVMSGTPYHRLKRVISGESRLKIEDYKSISSVLMNCRDKIDALFNDECDAEPQAGVPPDEEKAG